MLNRNPTWVGIFQSPEEAVKDALGVLSNGDAAVVPELLDKFRHRHFSGAVADPTPTTRSLFPARLHLHPRFRTLLRPTL